MARLLQINACDRATGIPSNCTFKLDRPIGGRYRLAMVQVPYVQPPMLPSTKSLILSVGSTITEIFFSEPVYTPAQLVAELQAQLNAAVAPVGLVFTVALDSSNRLVVSRNSTDTIIFYGHKDFNANALVINDKLAETLGIIDDISLTEAASATATLVQYQISLCQVTQHQLLR